MTYETEQVPFYNVTPVPHSLNGSLSEGSFALLPKGSFFPSSPNGSFFPPLAPNASFLSPPPTASPAVDVCRPDFRAQAIDATWPADARFDRVERATQTQSVSRENRRHRYTFSFRCVPFTLRFGSRTRVASSSITVVLPLAFWQVDPI